MLYTIPDYYKEFHCLADKCEDTCCAGWQISIDGKSLKKYKEEKGSFKRRLHKSIDWRSRTFLQGEEKRCAFLNQENLCEMYLALGSNSLCRTCRRYPRHIEEFENVREITLSLSCPAVAELLLGRKEPVSLLSFEREGEEEYEDFDPFFYSLLCCARDTMREILQDRGKGLELRTGLVLGIAHDMQVRVKRGELFSCNEVLERYKTEKAEVFIKKKLAAAKGRERYCFSKEIFAGLHRLELLKEEWGLQLKETEALLYGKGDRNYEKIHGKFECWREKHMPGWGTMCEQLLIYYIDTYFCGAVYDGRVYQKVQMAAVSVLVAEELLTARWCKNGGFLDHEDVVRTVYQYSREVEHSDKNLELLEKLMEEKLLPWFSRD